MKGLLFTYTLTYGGAAASLFNPYVGLMIYIVFSIVRPDSLWFWSVDPGNYSRIIGVALLIGWAGKGFGSWEIGRARGVVFALLGYLGWSVVSALDAPNEEVAWTFIENLSKIVLPFLVGITTIRSIQQLKCLAWVITLSQGYVAFDLNMAYLDGFNRVYEVGFGGMDNNCVAIAMVCGAGLAFFLGLGERLWWRRILAFAAAALMVHVIMFGMSRGGMLGLIVMGGVGFWMMPKRLADYAWFCTGLLVALQLAGPSVFHRFSSSFADASERDSSAQSRLDMWTICLNTMADNPVLGIGPDHWTVNASHFGLAEGKEAHTLWLQVGAELGFPGLALLICFYLVCMVRLWKLIRSGKGDPSLEALARLVIAALTGFIVAAQFVSLEGLELPYYVNLIGAGVLKLASCGDRAGHVDAERLEGNSAYPELELAEMSQQ